MIQKACNFLVPHASANLALYSGAARAVGLTSLDELAFKAVLAGFRKVYGGLWVGGSLTLDHERLWVRQNLMNRLAHTDDYSLSIPLEEILRAEWTFGVVTGIVVVHTVHGTLKLRCFGARPFQEELARAARRAQLAR